MTPTCPKCQRSIPDVDVSVASDVAFCRPCNFVQKLSDLVHGVKLDMVDMDQPPAGAWRRASGLEVVTGATHRSLGMAVGALAISLFWNGIVSVFVLVAVSATLANLQVPVPEWFPAPKMNGKGMGIGMTLFLWLFLTPFIAIGLAMIGAFMSALGGKTEVRIQHGNGVVFSGIGSLGWRRFNPEMVKEVRVEERGGRYRDRETQAATEIVLEMVDGKIIKFGSGLQKERRQFVAAALRQDLKR